MIVDVGGEESHDKIQVDDDVIGEAIVPIVEERVIDSSCAEMSDATDVSEQSIIPTIDDTTGQTVEPSLVSKKADNVVGDDVLEGDSADMSLITW
ncbi:hypothetical protein LIER_17894 [Lithospermum erythrorhizon]|uniref:Uncharacterized protein n=1 Tax=Lithospermum erythrorhizon TaxID=34254 RepID=A0AAV3QD33_LITER